MFKISSTSWRLPKTKWSIYLHRYHWTPTTLGKLRNTFSESLISGVSEREISLEKWSVQNSWNKFAIKWVYLCDGSEPHLNLINRISLKIITESHLNAKCSMMTSPNQHFFFTRNFAKDAQINDKIRFYTHIEIASLDDFIWFVFELELSLIKFYID